MKKIFPKNIDDCKISIPGSKSISHRMLICASLCSGLSKIENVLESEDIKWTLNALSCFGADIQKINQGNFYIQGFKDLPRFYKKEIYLGNSGTSLRLLAGIAALGSSEYILTGDKRLCDRPMMELIQAFDQVGIIAKSNNSKGTPPVYICGGNRKGGKVILDCSKSSQYLSSLLLIGPFFSEGFQIHLDGPLVSSPYIDITLDVMEKFGVTAERIHRSLYMVPGKQTYNPGQFAVEPDISNAGYFWAIGAITGKMITVKNISRTSLQGDLKQIQIFERMGCNVRIQDNEIGVSGSKLNSIEVDMSDTPDAVPAIAVVASFAHGKTRINNIKHLREKESDRIDAISTQLTKMGITVRQGDDFLEIVGGFPTGARIETFNDHRIAMAFSVPGLVIPGVEIENETCVEKSFPNYWEIFDAL